jgi:predicted transcriptional regulator
MSIIKFKIFVSYGQLREYLYILIENNLLEYIDGTHKFKTTEKGLNYLKMNNEIGELLQITTIKND